MLAETIRDLTNDEYELFRKLVYAQSGINLGSEKMQLVRARLGKLLRAGQFCSYREYYDHVKNDASGQELCKLLDAISTNTTHLFREKTHFDFLQAALRRWTRTETRRAPRSPIRIWSAACSSGEEPHSIVMTAHDALRASPSVQVKLLATDISTKMLERARAARYEPHRIGTVPAPFQKRYFRRVRQDATEWLELVPELQRMITFSRFNLMSEQFPFQHGFDVIFCRNVMIYFDRPTQQTLVNKFARHLRPGGYLLIGHSETLNSIQHPLKYVRPTIYEKGSA